MQIRGYKIRLPLDVMLVASANPEDYTNRGRIITPLKDRFGSQIRTHYPLDVETEMDDHRAGGAPARRPRASSVDGARLHDRDRRRDQPAGPALAARQPALGRVGAALDRQLRDAGRERDAPRRCATASTRSCPRVSDLDALVASTAGKIEIETHRRRPRGPGARAHREGERARGVPLPGAARAARRARARVRRRPRRPHRRGRRRRPSTPTLVAEHAGHAARRSATSASARRPAGLASAIEFVLEGLHLTKRLNKDAVGGRATYRSRG